jgi:hypothetical protein
MDGDKQDSDKKIEKPNRHVIFAVKNKIISNSKRYGKIK